MGKAGLRKAHGNVFMGKKVSAFREEQKALSRGRESVITVYQTSDVPEYCHRKPFAALLRS